MEAKNDLKETEKIDVYCYFDGCKNLATHKVEDLKFTIRVVLWTSNWYDRYVCDEHLEEHNKKIKNKKKIRLIYWSVYCSVVVGVFIVILIFAALR